MVDVLQQIHRTGIAVSRSHGALWPRSQTNHTPNTPQAFPARRRLPRDSATQEDEPELRVTLTRLKHRAKPFTTSARSANERARLTESFH